jgi:hypothetical protein
MTSRALTLARTLNADAGPVADTVASASANADTAAVADAERSVPYCAATCFSMSS